MHPVAVSERRRLLDKLIREVTRSEAQAEEHAPREAKRLGEVPPVAALRAIAAHAQLMRARFDHIVHAYDIPPSRTGIGATLSTLRNLVVDRVVDGERAYRTALLDLRHGIDVVKLLREIARCEELFGIIRWCDDWLGARRTLVARVEAQLVWFVEQAGAEIGIPPAPSLPLDEATQVDDIEAESPSTGAPERPSILDFK